MVHFRSVKSHRGHLNQEALNAARCAGLRGFMLGEVTLLGATLKLESARRTAAAVNKAL